MLGCVPIYTNADLNVGAEGFELSTSRTQTERSGHAELRPDSVLRTACRIRTCIGHATRRLHSVLPFPRDSNPIDPALPSGHIPVCARQCEELKDKGHLSRLARPTRASSGHYSYLPTFPRLDSNQRTPRTGLLYPLSYAYFCQCPLCFSSGSMWPVAVTGSCPCLFPWLDYIRFGRQSQPQNAMGGIFF